MDGPKLTLVERLECLLGLAQPVEDGGERLARLVVSGRQLHHPRLRRLGRLQVAHLEVTLTVLQPHRRLVVVNKNIFICIDYVDFASKHTITLPY